MSVHAFPPGPDGLPASPLSWKDFLDCARSERQVLAVVREYTARIDPRDLAALPAGCRPGKFFEADDVSGFALDLMRHHFTQAMPSAPAALELIAFFTHAAQRLSQITGSANEPAHPTRAPEQAAGS